MPGKPIVSDHSVFPVSFHVNVIWIAETVNKGFYCWADSSNNMLFICISFGFFSQGSLCWRIGLHFSMLNNSDDIQTPMARKWGVEILLVNAECGDQTLLSTYWRLVLNQSDHNFFWFPGPPCDLSCTLSHHKALEARTKVDDML